MTLLNKLLDDNLLFDIKNNIVKFFSTFSKFSKNFNYKYLFILIILTGIDIFIRQIYHNNTLQLQNSQVFYNKLKTLEKSKLVLKSLQFTPEQFIQHIEIVFEKEYAKIVDIKVNEPVKFRHYNVTTVEIKGIFIHDKFIFSILDEIHSYVGLSRIIGIKIEKSQLHNGVNVLDTVIVCEIYTK